MGNSKRKFSPAFWTANFAELLERAAYYGVFIVITLYLSRILAFNDIEAAAIAGTFSALLYFLPTFAGAYADKIGFKKSLLFAFSFLTLGYLGLGLLPTFIQHAGLAEYGTETTFHGLAESSFRYAILPVMALIIIGGSFIKSVITGTVSLETSEDNRATGFSIFYTIVNIGAFSGKTIVKPLRDAMGNVGLINISYFSAGMTLLALLAVFFFFKPSVQKREGKTFGEIWTAFIKVLFNVRLIVLIFIITGFWLVQHQLYATMPKYVLRMAGESASPSWYANVNPLVVFSTVALITSLMKRRTALFSMTVGMFIMPVSAFCMAAGNLFDGGSTIIGMHPVAFMMIVGIAFQGLAESFISPRFLEYFSFQAPKGEEGLYLGFSHLHSFLSSIVGFLMSGVLLDKYCPDPLKFGGRTAEWHAASANAHYIWYYFGGIAMVSALA
ncbi:MFS transporter [Saccharicrinis fermentans]|uniref:Putative dipeptide and tripeptide permease YjdL n=2 Tax=Saccharicrinis fermentans TaxID=982 RepID=W7YGG4_9BACT|nr:MFS transporter [Saccharicrinis fermentans]GAF03516.1 putative dipeptide and tripeptide permease YjdL [Saccharicrinis fermentans DSM 9555 = JCM 21142]